MRMRKLLAISWENLTQRRLRTSLTTLGVVIGVTAILGLASLGEGFRAGIKERMQQGFELDVLVVIPGSFTTGLGEFTVQDVDNIKNVSGINIATALITIPKATILSTENKKLNALTLAAVNFTEITQMLPERLVPMAGGAIPEPEENDTVILGYKSCFLNETAPLVHVGENVTIQISLPPFINVTKSFRVAAILERSGTSGITNFDYWAFIPLKTAINLLGREFYNIVLVKVSNIQDSERVANDIEKTFENPYSISILVPLAFMRQVDNILNFVQLFLMAIASVSLLVAGIGIMNIMTVSVMERTREIGILKAIGAKSRTILGLFLAEAILIGLAGGFIGIFTGYGLSYGLAYILSFFLRPQQTPGLRNPEAHGIIINPIFSLEWAAIAFFFSIVVCIIFGLYPARKASKLNPVEALRYE